MDRFRAYIIAALVTGAVFIVTVVVIMGFEVRCELSIRIAGLFFQLAGIGTVIWGIDTTRRLHGIPGLFSRRPPPVVGTGDLRSEPSTVRREDYGCMNTSTNDTAEKRIAALEKNLAIVNSKLSQFVSGINEINEQHDSQKMATYKRVEKIENKMRFASTDGIYLSMAGVFWVMLGTVMSAIPLEISRALSVILWKCF